jgi:hypothetical protein
MEFETVSGFSDPDFGGFGERRKRKRRLGEFSVKFPQSSLMEPGNETPA